MIRILQIGMSTNPGGVENFIMNIYRNVDRSKVQFDFLVDHNLKKVAYEDEIISLGGRIFREYYRRKEVFAKGRKSLKYFFKEHPEIVGVHFHANTINPMFKVVEVAKKQKLPIRIIHSHNTNYMTKMNLKDKVYEVVEKKRLGKISTHLLACSYEAGKWMFDNKKFEVIKNGIKLDEFEPNKLIREKIREELNIKDKIVIGHVGRMNYQKNSLFLIEIFKELHKINNNFVLLYIGDGDLKEEIINKIKEYHLEENIILTGANDDIKKFYQAMDFFILPSRFEGLPVALLEAQASQLNCYVSNAVSKDSNITGLVEFINLKSTANEWASKIIEDINKNKMINENILKQKFNESGYNIISSANRLEKIYLMEE